MQYTCGHSEVWDKCKYCAPGSQVTLMGGKVMQYTCGVRGDV